MRALLTVLAFHLVSGISFAGSGPQKPIIMAYYYPWYIAGDWSRHKYVGTPVLGKYGTDSPKVAKKHIDWCAKYRIDGLFISWWGAKTLTDRHLKKGLLKAPNLDKTSFAIFYEAFGRLDPKDGEKDGIVDFSQPKVMKTFISDFQYLAKNYFNHPQYWKLSRRPVVGVYVTRAFRGFTKDHLARLRKAIGVDVYIIADEVFMGRQSSPKTARNGKEVFDAYTAYNMMENSKVREHDTALSYQSREAFPIFRKWAKQTTFIPGVFPSYSDFRGNKTLAGSPEDFATLLDAAVSIATQPGSPVPPVVLVTSFNEWWEGTTIEPTKEYGNKYLEIIRGRQNPCAAATPE